DIESGARGNAHLLARRRAREILWAALRGLQDAAILLFGCQSEYLCAFWRRVLGLSILLKHPNYVVSARSFQLHCRGHIIPATSTGQRNRYDFRTSIRRAISSCVL